MEFIRTETVEVEGEEDAEVEVFVMNEGQTKKVEYDPFMKMDLVGLPTNLKRKVTRLNKAATASKTGQTKGISPEQLATAYDVFRVITPPYNLDFLAKLYEMNASHNAAVTMKAVNIVGLGYDWIPTETVKFQLSVLQRGKQSAVVTQMDAFALEKIKLNEKLAALNTEFEFNEIMTSIWIDVEALGNGYLEIGRNKIGKINYIGHIPGHTMRVRSARDGFVQIVSNKYTFFRNYGDTDTVDPTGQDPTPNEILQFIKYSPNSTYYGVPDIVAALPAALGDKFAREYNLDYFENKAVPRYAFILKGAKLSSKAESTLINYFKNELKGKNHGTLYIPLPAGFGQDVSAEFKQIEVGIQDSSFINYIKENRTEILMVHRVPPSKVGITHNANLAVSRDQDKTFKEQVCLGGDTLVVTPYGDVAIEKLVGTTSRLLTRDYSDGRAKTVWVDAPIKSFGYQSLKRMVVSRYGVIKEIHATPEHRWFVRKPSPTHKETFIEKRTDDLVPGDFLTSAFQKSRAHNVKHYFAGIPHGITFGDGHLESDGGAGIYLFGEKNSVLAGYFPNKVYGEYLQQEGGVSSYGIRGLPRGWKELPSLDESSAYLYGFLMGWFAADGSVKKTGTPILYNVNQETLEYAQCIARKIGINTLNIKETVRKAGTGIKGEADSTIYSLSFVSSDLPESFFLIEGHRERYHKRSRSIEDWKVVSVEDSGREEEVFCAVVEGTGNFVLSGNLLTGNCRPEQRRVEKKMQKIFEEFTKNFVLKFLEADIIDADIKSRINDRYLRTQVLVPNDILEELGKPTRPDGSKPLPFVKPGSTSPGSGGAAGAGASNQGGGASRNTTTGADTTGTRQVRGAAQSAGRTPKETQGTN